MLAIMLLPVPSSFAMPMADDAMPEHCRLTMSDHAMDGHDDHMQAAPAEQDDDAVACKCCGQDDSHCNGNCKGCMHLSAIGMDIVPLANADSSDDYYETSRSFITHQPPPHSRPPLLL